MASSIEIFLCYAQQDQRLMNELEKQLRALKQQGLIDIWFDREISAGTEYEHEIDKHLETAQIILLLVSPDFIVSDYCYSVEMNKAMERHEGKQARVIPVILRPVYWERAPFGKLKPLPSRGKAVISWNKRDEAYFDVAMGVLKVVEEIIGDQMQAQVTKTTEVEQLIEAYEAVRVGNTTDPKIIRDLADHFDALSNDPGVHFDANRAANVLRQLVSLTQIKSVTMTATSIKSFTVTDQ